MHNLLNIVLNEPFEESIDIYAKVDVGAVVACKNQRPQLEDMEF